MRHFATDCLNWLNTKIVTFGEKVFLTAFLAALTPSFRIFIRFKFAFSFCRIFAFPLIYHEKAKKNLGKHNYLSLLQKDLKSRNHDADKTIQIL